MAALPSAAQAQGVTVLRGESGEQQRPGVPDTGVRRVPSTNHPAPAPALASPPTTSNGGQLPLGNGTGVVPAEPPSEVAREIASGKPLSPAEAAALGHRLQGDRRRPLRRCPRRSREFQTIRC